MLIIGIAGGTGSGKTTVVHQIMNELPQTEVGIISQDSYYRETSNLAYDERTKINFDHPRAIDFELLVEHLKQLKKEKNLPNRFDMLALKKNYHKKVISIIDEPIITSKLLEMYSEIFGNEERKKNIEYEIERLNKELKSLK